MRGAGNADFRRLAAALGKKITPAQAVEGVPDEQGDKITVRLLSETILQDWSGLTEDDGAPLVYSRERAVALLSDPDLRLFRDGIDRAATIVATRMKAVIEDATKN